MEKYQLRYAAGMYWLLDMLQQEDKYKKPLSFNEVGARIWRLLQDKKGIEDISQEISRVYEIELEDARRDVEGFIEQLQRYHIEI